jgi:hypothetical protein
MISQIGKTTETRVILSVEKWLANQGQEYLLAYTQKTSNATPVGG